MYYNSNKVNKVSNPYNIKNFLENAVQTKEQSTLSLQPKTTINSKTDNLNFTENSENTINNINIGMFSSCGSGKKYKQCHGK